MNTDLLLDLIAQQRNVALDQLVAARAEAITFQARVKELEAELAKLKPQETEAPKE